MSSFNPFEHPEVLELWETVLAKDQDSLIISTTTNDNALTLRFRLHRCRKYFKELNKELGEGSILDDSYTNMNKFAIRVDDNKLTIYKKKPLEYEVLDA